MAPLCCSPCPRTDGHRRAAGTRRRATPAEQTAFCASSRPAECAPRQRKADAREENAHGFADAGKTVTRTVSTLGARVHISEERQRLAKMIAATHGCSSLAARGSVASRGGATGASSTARLAAPAASSSRRPARGVQPLTRAVLSEGQRASGIKKGRFSWDFLERSYDAEQVDRLAAYFDAMPSDAYLAKDGMARAWPRASASLRIADARVLAYARWNQRLRSSQVESEHDLAGGCGRAAWPALRCDAALLTEGSHEAFC